MKLAVSKHPHLAVSGSGRLQDHSPAAQNVERKLTIGMATYDDYDGVYFTAQAIRLYHPEVTQDTEILVVDNHPEGPAAELLRGLADSVEGYRYVAYDEARGTAPPRDRIFHEARTPFVMVLDCHVMFAPGSLLRLIDFFDRNPQSLDLLQGPLLHDGLNDVFTHFDPRWEGLMYGQWGTDERGIDPEGEPFEIPMHGLGVFACRREAWLGFNPQFRVLEERKATSTRSSAKPGERRCACPSCAGFTAFTVLPGFPSRTPSRTATATT